MSFERFRSRITPRKLLLLNCAIVRVAPFDLEGRTSWELLPTFGWFAAKRTTPLTAYDAVEYLEDHADGLATEEEVIAVHEYCRYAEYAAEADCFGYDQARLIGAHLRYGVAYWFSSHLDPVDNSYLERRDQLYRYLNLDGYPGTYHAWDREEPLHPNRRFVVLALLEDSLHLSGTIPALDPSWLTSDVRDLARTIYNECTFEDLPILSDALLDAGCENEEMIAHCRSAGPHLRGCWVIDLLLGYE